MTYFSSAVIASVWIIIIIIYINFFLLFLGMTKSPMKRLIAQPHAVCFDYVISCVIWFGLIHTRCLGP